jgi:hypothetical protein
MTLKEFLLGAALTAGGLGFALAIVIRGKAFAVILALTAAGILIVGVWPIDTEGGPPIYPPLLLALGAGAVCSVAGSAGATVGLVFHRVLARRRHDKA